MRSMSASARRTADSFPAASALAAAAVAIASWVPVMLGISTRAAVGWLAVAILAVVTERLTRSMPPVVLVTGLLAASTLVASGLVTESTRYMPVAMTGFAFAYRYGRDVWSRRRLDNLPPLAVVITVVAYLGLAAIATITSINHRQSLVYVAGMVGICALAFWALPATLADAAQRRFLTGAVGVIGVVAALTVYVISFVGPLDPFGRPIGDYLLGDVTITGQPTGFFFGRSSGVFLAPLEPSVMMALAIVSLLGWSSQAGRRARIAGVIAVFFLVPALLLTLDRSAWLATAVSACAYAVLTTAPKLKPSRAAFVGLFFAVCLGAVLTNLVGVNAVQKICLVQAASIEDCPPSEIRYVEINLRGGTELSGRPFLWQASVDAIKLRPVLGYGPGNDIPAIAAQLHGPARIYAGLTSHDSWLRIGVEMGVLGPVLMTAILLAVAGVFLRRLWLSGSAIREPAQLVLAASVLGLVPAMVFESFLIGGVTYANLYLALALGLMLSPAPEQGLQPAGAETKVRGSREQEVPDAHRRVADHP